MSELAAHLAGLGLEDCLELLVENGIELLSDVAHLGADDLEGLGFDASKATMLHASLSGGGSGGGGGGEWSLSRSQPVTLLRSVHAAPLQQRLHTHRPLTQ